MSTFPGRKMCVGLLSLSLCGCFRPPYNNFQADHQVIRQTARGAIIGGGAGAIIGGWTGAAIGGTLGTVVGLEKNTRLAVLRDLQMQDIQFVQYGNTTTLVVPTDRYYVFDTAQLNDICYPGLENIIKLLKSLPDCYPIYVAGFTDNVGSSKHKKMLSQARAEAMLTFLWANNIPARDLHAQGYGEQHTIGDNHWIRGSAYNRRIEIQWVATRGPEPKTMGIMKDSL